MMATQKGKETPTTESMSMNIVMMDFKQVGDACFVFDDINIKTLWKNQNDNQASEQDPALLSYLVIFLSSTETNLVASFV